MAQPSSEETNPTTVLEASVINISGTVVGRDLTIITPEVVCQQRLEVTSPYRGLGRFDERHKDFFFGRDSLVLTLVDHVNTSKILLLLGASGSGKSSVVRAGLIPSYRKLKKNALRVITLVPDINPFESLRSSLLQEEFSQSQTSLLTKGNPSEAANLLASLRKNENWLLFIDQFEELFTRSEPALRVAFFDLLGQLASESADPVILVFAMRAEFVAEFGAYPAFLTRIDKNIKILGDLRTDELRAAIVRPAAENGVVFDPGLVDQIMQDVQGQPGYLPLLQYTLNLLWENEPSLKERHLRKETYTKIGGVLGALEQRAEGLHGKYSNSSDQRCDALRHVLLRLVDISGANAETGIWRPVRRRVPRTAFHARPTEDRVVQELIEEKLLVSNAVAGSDATVEVAHEALFTSWGRLTRWIEDAKQVIYIRNQLAGGADRWRNNAKADEELLSGTLLLQAQEKQRSGDFDTVLGGLTEIQTEFLSQSAQLRDRKKAEERDRQLREIQHRDDLLRIESARLAQAELARRRGRRVAILSVVFGCLAPALVAGAMLSWLGKQRVAAEASRRDFIYAQACLVENKWPDAINAFKRAMLQDPKNREVRDGVWMALQYGARPAVIFPLQEFRTKEEITRSQFSPDGTTIVTVCHSNTAYIWDRMTGKLVGEALVHPKEVMSASFISDGLQVITSCGDGTVRIWDAATGRELNSPVRVDDWLIHAVLSPDTKSILTVHRRGVARLWHAATGKAMGEPLAHPSDTEILSAGFSPDGKWVVTTSRDGGARIWDALTAAPIGPGLDHGPGVKVIAARFSPDSRWLITGSTDHTARIWNPATGERDATLRHPGPGTIVSVSFSPDGRRVLTASTDNGARIWELGTSRVVGLVMQHPGPIKSAEFSRDGSRIATCAENNAYIWEAASGRAVGAALRHHQNVAEAAFDRSGLHVLTSSSDKIARIWDSATGQLSGIPLPHKQGIHSVAVSPRLIATASANTVSIWDSSTCQPLGEPIVHGQTVTSVSVSPSEQLLVTACADNHVRIWDLARRVVVGTPIRHEATITRVSFSADGRLFLTSSTDGAIRLWNTADGRPLGHPLIHQDQEPVIGAKFSADGSKIVGVSANVAVIWSNFSSVPQKKTFRHQGLVNDASFSPDGALLVTSCSDRMARVWSTSTGLQVRPTIKHADEVIAASFNTAGTRLVTVSGNSARIWQTTTCEPIGVPLLHHEDLNGAVFFPDGKRVVTAGADHLARVWDIATNEHPNPQILEGVLTLGSDREEALQRGPGPISAQLENALADYPEWRFLARSYLRRSPDSNVSPSSNLKLREASSRLISTGDEKYITEALGLDPGNPNFSPAK